MSDTAHVTLSAKKDGVHEGLWLVQVLEKEHGDADEAQEDGKVVCHKIV